MLVFVMVHSDISKQTFAGTLMGVPEQTQVRKNGPVPVTTSQTELQPSPSTRFPSSHVSGGVTKLSPHTGALA